jgi:hypothetical protein
MIKSVYGYYCFVAKYTDIINCDVFFVITHSAVCSSVRAKTRAVSTDQTLKSLVQIRLRAWIYDVYKGYYTFCGCLA